jgi:hypothetical protein
MIYSARLLEKIEELTEYLINNTQPSLEEVKTYYDFCYDLLVERRKLDEDESSNKKTQDALLEDDLSKLHLALHGLIYGKVYDQYASRQE